MDQLLLRLANQLIKRRDSNNRIKLKMITKLADLNGSKWWLTLDTKTLTLQKATAKQEYYQQNKKISSIRSTFLEERARIVAVMGNTVEENTYVPSFITKIQQKKIYG